MPGKKHKNHIMNPLPTYDSLKSCSAATGVSMACLKRFKNSGNSRAFKSNRVDLNILIIEMSDVCMTGWDDGREGEKWLDPQQEKARNDKARADKVLLEIAQIKKELLPRAEVERLYSALIQSIIQRGDQMGSKLGAVLCPADPVPAAKTIDDYWAELKRLAQADFKTRVTSETEVGADDPEEDSSA